MEEKYCLKWNDFFSHASRAFGLLRSEDFLQDVILVGDDNCQVAAHKLVLSACSEYFKTIFKNNNHSILLLCLEGVTSKEIQNILDYIYNGEVNIFQEELDRFLSVAKRLKLEGLLVKEEYEEQKSDEVSQIFPPLNEQSPLNVKHEIYEEKNCGNFDTSENDAMKFVMSEEEKTNLVETVGQHLERNEDGSWKCRICGKSANKKQQMQYHVEGKHLQGVSLPCNLCGKIYRSRNSLIVHKSRKH